MEPRGKLLKELIEDFRAKGAGMDALDKAKEAFKSLEGRMPTKEEYASVISNTKKTIKNIISPAQEPAAESLKETPVVGKALENLKKTFNNVPESTTTEALQQESKVAAQIEPRIKEDVVIPQPKAQLEGIEVPGPGKIPEDPLTGIRALPESKADTEGPIEAAAYPYTHPKGLGNLQKLGVAGAGLAGFGSSAGEPPTPKETPRLKAAMGIGAVTNGQSTSAQVAQVGGQPTVEEASVSVAPKVAPKVKTYKPEDLKAMLREVDKTPFSYAISAEQKADLQSTRDDIADKNNELITSYKADLKAAQDEKERKDLNVAYASAFERIGLAMTTFFAAKRGMEIGQNVSQGVRELRPTDWMEMTKQHLADYDVQRKGMNDVLALEQAPLDDARKEVNAKAKEMSANAFQLGREEAKRREGVADDNVKTLNRVAEINTKEKNDAGQAGVSAANTLAEDERKRAFYAEQNDANRASKEGIADTRADVTRETAALRISSKLGIAPEKLDQQQQAIYAKAQAAYQTLTKHRGDKNFEHELSQNLILLKATPEKAQEIIDDANRSAFGKLFNGSNGQQSLQGLAPNGAAGGGQGKKFRNPQSGAVGVIIDPAKQAAAISKGFVEVP